MAGLIGNEQVESVRRLPEMFQGFHIAGGGHHLITQFTQQLFSQVQALTELGRGEG